MNELSHTPIIRDGKHFYFLSLFYAREKWSELISEINNFQQNSQIPFCDCLICFSTEKGEHLQLTLITSSEENRNFSDEIQTFFQLYFERNPSISKTPFPYGKAVWCNYPNNSLAWNKFKMKDYSEQYLNFHKKTIDTALKLLIDDFSEDNFLSLGIYLITKGLCYFDDNGQKDLLLQALKGASVSSPHLVFTTKELVNEIDINEIGMAIEFCRNDNPDDYSKELIIWLEDAGNFLKFHSFNKFCTSICEIIGLKGLRQLMILELLNKWFYYNLHYS